MIDKDKLMKIMPLAVLILLIVAIPATLYLVRQIQDLRSKAAIPVGAVTLSLAPNEAGKNVGEEFEMQLGLNARNQDITGTDVQLGYDKNILELLKFEPSLTGFTTLRSDINNNIGRFRFIAVKQSGPSATGILTLGTLRFKALAQGSSSVEFPSFELVASGAETDLLTSGNIKGTVTVTGPGGTPPPTTPPPVAGCACQTDNTCSSPCKFNKLTGIIQYGFPLGTGPISCLTPESIHNVAPDNIAPDFKKNSYCNRPRRTEGDANADNKIDVDDYLYYLTAVSGGKVPVSVDPDFNGNGDVGPDDLEIWKRSVNP